MSKPKITFIGAGNMAQAIIGGLITQGYPANKLSATGPRQDALNKVANEFGIEVNTNNAILAADADVIILAVKPQLLKEVATELRLALAHKPLIISVAAGISTASLASWLGENHAIVRCMPNTPAKLRLGASGMFANTAVSKTQKQVAEEIFSAVGIVEWVTDEALINAVTAVSGSGPAYFFLIMEAMIDAGVQQGLTRECAAHLTLQTALGAATLAVESDLDVVELRRRVTSPKGTTEQAINSFEQDKVREIVKRAMQACAARARELSELLGK